MPEWRLRCRTCSKVVKRAINGECSNCFLESHLPSKIRDEPWIYAADFGTRMARGREDSSNPKGPDIARAVVARKFELSDNGQTIWLLLDDRREAIRVTTEGLDSLALRSGILVGKWLVYRSRESVDDAWRTIANATFDGALGRGAKVSTAHNSTPDRRHVICVYTRNYLDLEDVKQVRASLADMGFTEALCYKPDIYTYLSIYRGTIHLSPCRYRE